MELPGVVVHSLYKPPPEPFLLPPRGQRIKPHIVIGDFNSHSTLWGYTTTDSDGEAVEQWADSNRLSLIHAMKLPKSFNSAIWKNGYNPYLIFVSSNILDMCEKSVLDAIPFCGYVCSTSLGEIISCPETEPRAKPYMQSRHRMPEANQCRIPVLAGWNCATRHQERCMCTSGKDQTGNQ